MHSKVEIKGIRDGLLVTLGEGAWPEIRDALLEQIQQKADFFRGARLALDVGNQVLHAVELGQLRDMLSEHGLTLWAVLSNSPLTQQTTQTLGMATALFRVRPDRVVKPLDTSLSDGEQAILVQRTLRSGFSLKYPGHVVVIGDVNPGAEIIAGGNVVVWGRLKGVVHAGAEGNELAIICALELEPTQLRIAGRISIPPKRRGKLQPELARLQNGNVVAETWNPSGK